MGFQVSLSTYKTSAPPPPVSTTVTINPGPNSSGGPLFNGEQVGYNDGQVSGGPPNYNNGSSTGGVPGTQTMFGVQVQALTYEDGFGNFKNEVILYGSHPQNFFSTMSFLNTIAVLETYLSSAATYNVFTGTNGTFTSWQWNAMQHYPFGFGGSKVITFVS